jgi:hypothetical protein
MRLSLGIVVDRINKLAENNLLYFRTGGPKQKMIFNVLSSRKRHVTEDATRVCSDISTPSGIADNVVNAPQLSQRRKQLDRQLGQDFPKSVELLLGCKSRISAGGVPERSKGADCKSAGSAFGGSNPPPSTHIRVNVDDCIDRRAVSRCGRERMRTSEINTRFDKSVWNKFEPPQAGPEGGVQGCTE